MVLNTFSGSGILFFSGRVNKFVLGAVKRNKILEYFYKMNVVP